MQQKEVKSVCLVLHLTLCSASAMLTAQTKIYNSLSPWRAYNADDIGVGPVSHTETIPWNLLIHLTMTVHVH